MPFHFSLGSLVIAGLLVLSGPVLALDKTKAQQPSRPVLPSFKSLHIQPPNLKLLDARDARRVLVWGITEGGRRIDLTSDSKLEPKSPVVRVDSEGYLNPVTKGE